METTTMTNDLTNDATPLDVAEMNELANGPLGHGQGPGNAARNASPLPMVSSTSTGKPSWLYKPVSSSSTAPFSPSVTQSVSSL